MECFPRNKGYVNKFQRTSTYFCIFHYTWAVSVLFFKTFKSLCTRGVFFIFIFHSSTRCPRSQKAPRAAPCVWAELASLQFPVKNTKKFSKHSFYLILVQSSADHICCKEIMYVCMTGTKSNCFLITYLKCRKGYSPAPHWYFVDNAPSTCSWWMSGRQVCSKVWVKSPLQRSAAPKKGVSSRNDSYYPTDIKLSLITLHFYTIG